MKNVVKSIIFVAILFVLVELTTLVCLQNDNVKKFGLLKTATYDILQEKNDTIDVITAGDSLIYSSINPMQIWNDYGYSVYDCAEPAQLISDTYKNLQVAVESQHPKIVFMEANVLFRDPKKKAWYHRGIKKIQNLVPIYKHHNNWKKLLFASDNDWINVNKGYKYIKKVVGSTNYDYMEYSPDRRKFPKGNIEYFKKILKLCEDNDIKFVLISTPSQVSYNYPRLKTVEALAEELNFEYIDLNYGNPLNIDWTVETKDAGGHLNYLGAQKVSAYLGEYIKNTNLVQDHREEEEYTSWNEAYKIFINND